MFPLIRHPPGTLLTLFQDVVRSRKDEPGEASIEELYVQLGRLKMETVWLKKRTYESLDWGE